MALQSPKKNQGTSVSLSGYGLSGTAKLGDNAGSSKSPHREVNRLFENTTIDEARADLVAHKALIDRQFEEAYADALAHNFRLTPDVVAHHHALQLGATIEDKKEDNRFRIRMGTGKSIPC
jgi:hypothetical protein